jgi:hypothetical protein
VALDFTPVQGFAAVGTGPLALLVVLLLNVSSAVRSVRELFATGGAGETTAGRHDKFIDPCGDVTKMCVFQMNMT